ncbi:SUMF1/EgtB/PvdO family nonheme iron enzyme, partial [Mesotoga prima]|uniref:SUMF1/EgtB/PvdO family nonheme iron enzyme n=1 Tax=Mesotoga prima TaxID=1184387 RepID=UPI002FE4202B
PNLEQAVRDAIDKPTGPIYLSDVTPLTELRANSRNIVNLSGIEALKNLQRLHLWDNSINDLLPISSLTELRELNLHRNNFSDLTPLAALTHIGWLAIDGNLVTDLSPIFGLSSLTSLFVSGNPIANLAQLEHFSWLYSFGINSLGVSDISFVEDFEKLRLLYFANNNVTDISPLLNTSIVQLNVGNNPITDVELLATMPWIKMLIAEGLGLTDIAFLGGLSDLWYLWLDNNLISDLTPLASLTKLEQLYIRNNRVSDLAAIANLPLLDWIQIENNRIGDLSPLANLARVRSINLNDNHISDVSPLVSNPAIDAGDSVPLLRNYLDLTPGSTDMQNIQALLDRGVNVYFSSQKSFPDEPTTPVPTNGETEVELTPLLSWEGTDPDGNPLTFDLFIGESATDLTLAATELDVSQWQIPDSFLTWSKTYYWKVISKENEHIYTEGPVWSFETGAHQLAVPEVVLVEGGTFMMGDAWGDGLYTELPVHEVTLTYDFWLGKYEVTFEEYDAFCDATGRSKPGDLGMGRGKSPVIYVNWWDAIAYCNWLSQKEGLPFAYRLSGEPSEGQMLDANGNVTTDITKVIGYRLPTEAEWEYAARGGKHHSPNKYSGSDNVDEVAWHWYNSGYKTHEVGLKLPNALGICDMSGNVWEWCSDFYDSGYYAKSPMNNPYNYTAGSYRVNRGGGWHSTAIGVRVAYRGGNDPTDTNNNLGFRIAGTVP